MDPAPPTIKPVRLIDTPAITRMVFANMTGVDQQFTAMTQGWFGRWSGYLILPIYLWLSGRGYRAMVDGRIAGCAYLYERKLSGYVFNVNVNEPYRRRGVARALMAHLEGLLRRDGRSWAALHVDRDNIPARRLYQQLHYRPYLPDHLRRGDVLAPAPTPDPALKMELLGGEGPAVFEQLAVRERETGDEWVAAVIGAEYSQPARGWGQYWRCRWQDAPAGCLWLSGDDPGLVSLYVMLEPRYWGGPLLPGIVAWLANSRGAPPPTLDLYLGSSHHYTLAATQLRPFGFTSQTQSRVLMLKRLN